MNDDPGIVFDTNISDLTNCPLCGADARSGKLTRINIPMARVVEDVLDEESIGDLRVGWTVALAHHCGREGYPPVVVMGFRVLRCELHEGLMVVDGCMNGLCLATEPHAVMLVSPDGGDDEAPEAG